MVSSMLFLCIHHREGAVKGHKMNIGISEWILSNIDQDCLQILYVALNQNLKMNSIWMGLGKCHGFLCCSREDSLLCREIISSQGFFWQGSLDSIEVGFREVCSNYCKFHEKKVMTSSSRIIISMEYLTIPNFHYYLLIIFHLTKILLNMGFFPWGTSDRLFVCFPHQNNFILV